MKLFLYLFLWNFLSKREPETHILRIYYLNDEINEIKIAKDVWREREKGSEI